MLKKVLFFLAIVLGSASSGVSGAFVQKKANTATGATQVVVTFDAPTTSGNLLAIGVSTAAANRTLTVVTSAGDTVTQVDVNSNATGAVYYVKNCGVSTTATFSVSGGTTSLWMAVIERSGADRSSPLDQHTFDTAGSTNPSSGATGTTAQDREYVFGFGTSGATQTSVTNANDTSYTVQITEPSGAARIYVVDKDITTAGAQTAKAKLASSTTWFMFVATFKDSDTVPVVVYQQSQSF